MENSEFCAIMGPSSSERSTLMNVIGCLDTPTEGQYRLDKRDVSTLHGCDEAAIRLERGAMRWDS